MAPSTPLTPRRARVIAERQSLEQQINQQAEEFAPPTPNSPACTGTCHYIKRLCYGRGEVFDNIGRFSGLVRLPICFVYSLAEPIHSVHLTRSPRHAAVLYENSISHSSAAQLAVGCPARALWIKFDLTGKKWGKQDVPAYLLGRVPPPTPPSHLDVTLLLFQLPPLRHVSLLQLQHAPMLRLQHAPMLRLQRAQKLRLQHAQLPPLRHAMLGRPVPTSPQGSGSERRPPFLPTYPSESSTLRSSISLFPPTRSAKLLLIWRSLTSRTEILIAYCSYLVFTPLLTELVLPYLSDCTLLLT